MKKKRIRDGAATQSTVLSTAERLFSERGFSGTSIGLISKESGISAGLILHHYKTKDALYQAVRERVADRYRLVLEDKRGDSDQTDSRLGETMLGLFQTALKFFRENETFHRISLWSFLEGKTDVAEKEAAITSQMAELVKAAQEGGLLQDDFDPVTLLTMTIGSIHYWLRYRDQFIKILGYDDSNDQLDSTFLSEASRILVRGTIQNQED